MTQGEGSLPEEERAEIVLITRPTAPEPPHPLEALREIVTSSVGLATYTATTMASLIEQTVTATVGATVNATLDRVVPLVADAIVDRLDLTDLVMDRVDLVRIVDATLDRMDLTALVLERVDIDAIVGAADIESVIDRVPIIPIADYVIDEIDLPQIIRDSTSGVAGEALDSVRRQGVGADLLLARMVDRVIRRRSRRLDAPGDPESLSRVSMDDGATEPPPAAPKESS